MNKFYIAALCACLIVLSFATACRPEADPVIDSFGCVVRTDAGRPAVHLVFSADSMFEGGAYALDVLDSAGVKGSFFFTGNFLRDSANSSVIRRAIEAGHYVGPHGDRHIQLADWDAARTTLATPDSMLADLEANYTELARFGVPRDSALYVLPSFEWCNGVHSAAMRSAGLVPVNITPGIDTYRDYTTPGMPEYQSSERMLAQLWDFERQNGLNGAIIILHLGTQDIRTDKLYRHLPGILDSLKARGYSPYRIDR